MTKKLKIVTPTPSEDLIFTSSDPDNPQLNEFISGIYKTVGIEGSRFRPIRCSELLKKLKAWDWGITERKYIQRPIETLMVKTSQSSAPVDLIATSTGFGVSVTSAGTIPQSLKNSFLEEYKDILNNMNEQEIYLHNSAGFTVDLIPKSGCITIEGNREDYIYTNMVDLRGLENFCKISDLYAVVDLGILYTYREGVQTYRSMFKVFPVDSESPVLIESNDCISIEFANGVVEVFPKQSDVTECIISNYSVVYGRK